MVAPNYTNWTPPTQLDVGGLKRQVRQRVHDYFQRNPEESFEELLLVAVRQEIDRREGTGGAALPASRIHPRETVTEEDVRLHTWLAERLEAVGRERTLWGRAKKFLRTKIF
jgi:hypothetical protein